MGQNSDSVTGFWNAEIFAQEPTTKYLYGLFFSDCTGKVEAINHKNHPIHREKIVAIFKFRVSNFIGEFH